MSDFEIISVSLSVIAVIVSAYTFFRSRAFASANVELYINERITNTKERVEEISLQMAPLLSKKRRTGAEKRQLEIIRRAFDAAIENNLNAYEEACAKYLDKKVDRKRFQKMYRVEVPQLVEKPELKDYFDAITSRYKAILKVYEMWENAEK